MQQLDYSVPEGTVVIGYSGKNNEKDAWRIVESICDELEDGATYISNLPAWKLLSPNETVGIQFKSELTKLFDNDTEEVDHTKVFAATELECIFKNDTFQYINGIPKSELESIYRFGDVGKQLVYTK